MTSPTYDYAQIEAMYQLGLGTSAIAKKFGCDRTTVNRIIAKRVTQPVAIDTTARDVEIAVRRWRGESMGKIAHATQLNARTIKAALVRVGQHIDLSPRMNKMERASYIARLYSEGLSITRIAEKVKLSHTSVARSLERKGIRMRSRASLRAEQGERDLERRRQDDIRIEKMMVLSMKIAKRKWRKVEVIPGLRKEAE